jgi:hypothetical protein
MLSELLNRANNASLLELEEIVRPWMDSLYQDSEIRLKMYARLPKDVFEQVFNLTEMNMAEMYKRCRGWGWNPKEKKKEFKHKDSRFAVITKNQDEEQGLKKRRRDERVVGFVHFRFELDEDVPEVLQLYM